MMRTDDLIASLAADLSPTPRHAVERRVALGIGAGAAVTLALVLTTLGFRPDLAQALHGFTFWMKWAYTIAFGAIAMAATLHLTRPEARRVHWLWLLVVPIGLLACIAAFDLMHTPAADWQTMWLGDSWRVCAMRVVLFSVPIFAGLIWSFRRFAPTRLRLTGAVAGLASGGCAATLYALACPETAALFVLTWYSLGIGLATIGGALAGPRLLRW